MCFFVNFVHLRTDLYYCSGLSQAMNSVKMEIDEPLQSSGAGLTCCLIDNGIRCHRPTGNASYSKRIAKTVTQRRLKLVVDQTVSASDNVIFMNENKMIGFWVQELELELN